MVGEFRHRHPCWRDRLTTEQAQTDGKAPVEAIEAVTATLADQVNLGVPIVAFNARFDLTMLDRDALRHGVKPLSERTNCSPCRSRPATGTSARIHAAPNVSVQVISHNQRFSSPAGVHAAGWPEFYVKSAIQLGLSLSSVHAQAQIPSIMVGGERLPPNTISRLSTGSSELCIGS